jgi:hypothetical protein
VGSSGSHPGGLPLPRGLPEGRGTLQDRPCGLTACANPHLLPHLGLPKPPGHTIPTLLLHRLDPEKLQEALLRVFPRADLGEVLVVDGKHLKKGNQGEPLAWASDVRFT